MVALAVDRAAVFADQQQHRWLHASGRSWAKLPSVHRRSFDLENSRSGRLKRRRSAVASAPNATPLLPGQDPNKIGTPATVQTFPVVAMPEG